jgi:flagellar basal-body rod modification protein FlgD
MITATSTLPSATAVVPSTTAATASVNPGQTLTQNDFLNLLTAQLEKQDPLNPMTGTEFAAELAQFATATGVQGLQTGLAGLNTIVSATQASGLVGHNVAVAGNTLVLGSGGATGAVDLAAAANDVSVSITGAAGQTVATLDLGAMPAGVQAFSWNGQAADGSPVAPGTYRFAVTAVGASGAAVSATPAAIAPVTAVSLGGQSGPLLDLGGGLAPVALTAVQQVF